MASELKTAGTLTAGQHLYRGHVPVLQPRGQLGAVGEHLEQRGSQGAVVVPPHSPHTAEPAGHLRIALQQHTASPQEDAGTSPCNTTGFKQNALTDLPNEGTFGRVSSPLPLAVGQNIHGRSQTAPVLRMYH